MVGRLEHAARNAGGPTFTDVMQASGAAGRHRGVRRRCVGSDGRRDVDLFLAGSNRPSVADGDGTFHEADATVFRRPTYGGEDDVTGVAIDDVNRDGSPTSSLDSTKQHRRLRAARAGAPVPERGDERCGRSRLP